MKHPRPYDSIVRQAALPEVLFSADVALALNVSQVKAALAIRAGTCGPYLLVAGRPAILRTEFLAELSSRAAQPERRKEVIGPVPTRKRR